MNKTTTIAETINKDVTVVMTSYLNHDFTMAALWALWKFYPDLSVIIADGSGCEECQQLYNRLTMQDIGLWNRCRIINLPGAPTEDCRNAAAALVQTEYILFMDNDTKVLGEEAIPLLLEPLNTYVNCCQSGAYGLVCVDREKRIGFVGTEFDRMTQLSASPCYFSLHHAACYRDVGGMPRKFFYDVPEELWKKDGKPIWQPGWSGDFSITNYYARELGMCCMSPRKRVPVVHWGQANRWQPAQQGKLRSVEDWWYKNVRHYTLSPLNSQTVEEAMRTMEIWEEVVIGSYQSLFEVTPRTVAQDHL